MNVISVLPLRQLTSPYSVVRGIFSLPMGKKKMELLVNCEGVTKSMTEIDSAPTYPISAADVVVIPFLDSGRVCGDVFSVVLPEELFGIAGICDVSLRVEKGLTRRNFVLHTVLPIGEYKYFSPKFTLVSILFEKTIAKCENLGYNHFRVGAWCSGSTWASDSHGVGSIPIAPANADTPDIVRECFFRIKKSVGGVKTD